MVHTRFSRLRNLLQNSAVPINVRSTRSDRLTRRCLVSRSAMSLLSCSCISFFILSLLCGGPSSPACGRPEPFVNPKSCGPPQAVSYAETSVCLDPSFPEDSGHFTDDRGEIAVDVGAFVFVVASDSQIQPTPTVLPDNLTSQLRPRSIIENHSFRCISRR